MTEDYGKMTEDYGKMPLSARARAARRRGARARDWKTTGR